MGLVISGLAGGEFMEDIMCCIHAAESPGSGCDPQRGCDSTDGL